MSFSGSGFCDRGLNRLVPSPNLLSHMARRLVNALTEKAKKPLDFSPMLATVLNNIAY